MQGSGQNTHKYVFRHSWLYMFDYLMAYNFKIWWVGAFMGMGGYWNEYGTKSCAILLVQSFCDPNFISDNSVLLAFWWACGNSSLIHVRRCSSYAECSIMCDMLLHDAHIPHLVKINGMFHERGYQYQTYIMVKHTFLFFSLAIVLEMFCYFKTLAWKCGKNLSQCGSGGGGGWWTAMNTNFHFVHQT